MVKGQSTYISKADLELYLIKKLYIYLISTYTHLIITFG